MEENINIKAVDNVKPNYPVPHQMGFFKRVLGVFLWPGKTMQSLTEKPRVLFPLLFAAIAQAIMIIAVFPMYREYLRIGMEAAYSRMDVDIQSDQFEQILNVSAMTSPIGMAITAVATLLLGALVLWIVIKLFKGQGYYKQILSITGYSYVISVLPTIVQIIKTNVIGVFNLLSYTSAAVLMPKMDGSFIYGMAKSLDVFSIWQYVVLAIGLVSVSKLEKRKVYMIVGVIFVLQLLFAGITEIRTAALL